MLYASAGAGQYIVYVNNEGLEGYKHPSPLTGGTTASDQIWGPSHQIELIAGHNTLRFDNTLGWFYDARPYIRMIRLQTLSQTAVLATMLASTTAVTINSFANRGVQKMPIASIRPTLGCGVSHINDGIMRLHRAWYATTSLHSYTNPNVAVTHPVLSGIDGLVVILGATACRFAPRT